MGRRQRNRQRSRGDRKMPQESKRAFVLRGLLGGDVGALSKTQLQALCREFGVSFTTRMTKSELLDRLSSR